MRRKERQINDREAIIVLLKNAQVGRLATIGTEGFPNIKPLNFVYLNDALYFHSAKTGEKIEDIKRNNKVCFEVDVPVQYIKSSGDPCMASYHYKSVLVWGRRLLLNQKKRKLLH
ncbi:MAG: pyridoxamine 5'-phosphate oxidase family protein [Nitrospinae bacterium]|nr:pyridoxamine 5'-phosphate oxidase family protein [Nitrospinota bacterium]